MIFSRKNALLGILVIAALLSGAAARAEDVVAVVNSGPGPYQTAYDSFVKDFGPVVSFHLPKDKPAVKPGTRAIVVFGGNAALQNYPEGVPVIACLAPGLASRAQHGRSFVSVSMKPPPEVLLGRLRKLQPRLKRLAVIWSSEITEDYLENLKSAGAGLGIEILSKHVSEPEGVPDALRGLLPEKADALWLAPDPALITPETFQTIKQFSWDNGLPFYAPTKGLVAAGAAAAVSVSAEESGREAAALARRALSGETLPETVYPEKTELTVNSASAAKAGLVIGPESLGSADQVIP